MNIELNITQKEFERLSILALRQNITVGEYLINHIDTNLEAIDLSRYNKEIDTLALFLTRYETIENLEDFLYWVDDVAKLQKDLKEHQEELEKIKTSRQYTDEEERQEDIDDMQEDIEDITKDIATSQVYVDDVVEAYKKHNPTFDLENEINQCRTWLNSVKETK